MGFATPMKAYSSPVSQEDVDPVLLWLVTLEVRDTDRMGLPSDGVDIGSTPSKRAETAGRASDSTGAEAGVGVGAGAGAGADAGAGAAARGPGFA